MKSFPAKTTLTIGKKDYFFYRLGAVEQALGISLEKIPYSIRILLENLLRLEDGVSVRREDIEALAEWSPRAKPTKEIAFMPARIILQDFTGVPAMVDLAAMRDAIRQMGGDPAKINPLQPADLVIDHSVQVDYAGTREAFSANVRREFERNRERYQFLKWGQQAFGNFRVVPPGTGIIHQVNLEYLASVVFRKQTPEGILLYPDTLVGTDSHTTMINGLGVLGWGVGGIEAEAAMLGQPVSMLIPEVVGFRMTGRLSEGVTATDLVLTVTERLRRKGVVGKFVEFFGPGLDGMPLTDRATVANMAPEYGATMGFFPADEETIRYLRLTGKSAEELLIVETYLREQGLFRGADAGEPEYSDILELDLGSVEASIAGPKRPQDRIALKDAKHCFRQAVCAAPANKAGAPADPLEVSVRVDTGEEKFDLKNGAVVIASITSCTNTSNPSVMLAAGCVARKAVEKGLTVKPWVKASLSPGSRVVTEYLEKSGLTPYLEKLKFHLTGYGCMTCIGNSGPLAGPLAAQILKNSLSVASVLSGNRNFEGRVHPLVRMNYLASPPLVVAYALAGTMDIDFLNDPIGRDTAGRPVFLKDLWPGDKEISDMLGIIGSGMFAGQYASVTEGGDDWRALPVPHGTTFAWDEKSTYVKNPPYFEGMPARPGELKDIRDARVLAYLGDSVTTDHISPAGDIAPASPAGQYLISLGVDPVDFNSYGARRGNHEVMMRGTFANIRLKNFLAGGEEGPWTRFFPGGEKMSIFEAAMRYRAAKIPLVVLAGKEYGTGSSRDWAAKGPRLLGVRAVLASSFERIHRSNLIGMGILPLQFEAGKSAADYGLTGEEIYSVEGIEDGLAPAKKLTVTASAGASLKTFTAICRLDTPVELAYYRHGGILPYVLRSLVAAR